MIHNLPKNSGRFSTTVNNVRGSNATSQIQSRAERNAAASMVRDLVRRESQLTRNGQDQTELELRKVRAKIDAYCAEYTGLDALVAELRIHHHLPTQIPAAISA